MTLRHMMIFRAVCDAGCNSTKAAEALHMTQPAVSLAIKELEQYYGVRLFDRMGRRLQLTDTGRQFLRYAVHICDLFSDMETEFRDWGAKGVLRVGASITIGTRFLPEYVRTYAAICPDVEVRVVVEQADRLEKKLLANELDCALTEGIAHDPSILSEPYMEDHLSVVCSPQRGWRQDQTITLEQFTKQRFLLRERGSGTREVFDRAMAQAGVSITPIWEAMSTTALVNAVIQDLGIAVLPCRLIQPALRQGRIVTVHVQGVAFKRHFYMIHHKDKFLTESAKAFMALCRNYEKEHPQPAFCALFEDA